MKKSGLVLAAAGLLMTAAPAFAAVKSVVLVHGAFVDGSGWKPVADILERDGYSVYVVQEPLTSLEADVAATRLVLDRAGPSVLVGHSWGGMVISEAGNHPSVRSLVYVAAFQPIAGESAGALQAQLPPAATSVVPVGGGFLQVDPESFHQDVAQDLPARCISRPSRRCRLPALRSVPSRRRPRGRQSRATRWSPRRIAKSIRNWSAS
jgi:pimeloyl-ACP methyl ester carboxylesterase